MLSRKDFFRRVMVHGFGNLQDFNRFLALAQAAGFTDLTGLAQVMDEFVKSEARKLISQEKREERKYLTPQSKMEQRRAKRAQRQRLIKHDQDVRHLKTALELRKDGLVCPSCGSSDLVPARGIAELVLGCRKCRYSMFYEGKTGMMKPEEMPATGDLK